TRKRGDRMDLEIVVQKETGEIAELVLRGRLDVTTSDQLKARVEALVQEGYRHLLVNMRRVKMVDSKGLSELLKAQKRVQEAKGSLRLVHISPAVAKALEMLYLDNVFSIYENTQEAVAALARGDASRN
ncbi:MAG: STAS domain-containing protein, partial [Armatimonadota bacterium]|nr:STAS domain-containing protein [Armatimonadota bacterium]